MSSKIVGFIGLEAYDVMHYASKILKKFEKKVLLIDASDTKALALTVTDVELKEDEVFDNHGVDVARLTYVPETEGYDYIYIFFGWNMEDAMIAQCEEVFCFTDFQLQNVKRLQKLVLPMKTGRFLVLRDVAAPEYEPLVVEALRNLNPTEDNVLELGVSPVDVLYRIRCQYETLFHFAEVSTGMKNLLFKILECDIDKKELAKQYKSISKEI